MKGIVKFDVKTLKRENNMQQIIINKPITDTLDLDKFSGQYRLTHPIAYLTEGKKRIALLQKTENGYGFVYLHKILSIVPHRESHFNSYCVKGAVEHAVYEGRVVLSFCNYTEFLKYTLEHNLLNKD